MSDLTRVNIRVPRSLHEWYRAQAKGGMTMQAHMWMALEQYMMQREALYRAKDLHDLYRELADAVAGIHRKLDALVTSAGARREAVEHRTGASEASEGRSGEP